MFNLIDNIHIINECIENICAYYNKCDETCPLNKMCNKEKSMNEIIEEYL